MINDAKKSLGPEFEPFGRTNDFVNLPEAIGMYSNLLELRIAAFIYYMSTGNMKMKSTLVRKNKSEKELLKECLQGPWVKMEIVELYFISMLVQE